MKKFLLLAFIALIVVPGVALAITSQRAQLPITIVVNVTPNPLARTGPGVSDTIVARAHLHGAPAAIERVFEAQQLHFVRFASQSMIVAQSSKQKAVEVEAEITPNPNATLLTTNASGQEVVVNGEAGIPVTIPCAYMVKVQTTVSNWQLKDGLYSDFSNGSVTFPGGDVSHSTYVASPAPSSSPFVVYQTNGGSWHIINGAYYSGTKNFCVDLTLSIPLETAQGQYVSNAIYTLYY